MKQFKLEIAEDRENQIKQIKRETALRESEQRVALREVEQRAVLQEEERIAQLKSQGIVICKKCNEVKPITKGGANAFIFVLLLFPLIVPGIIYLMMFGEKYICPKCGNEIKD